MEKKYNEIVIELISKKYFVEFNKLIKENKKFIKNYFPKTIESNLNLSQTKKFIDAKIDDAKNKKGYFFIIIYEKKVIGSVGIRNIEWEIPKCELGYFIDENNQGKGIMTEVIKKVLKVCFIELEMEKVYVRTNKYNLGSIKAIENNGFVKEGTLMSDYRDSNNILLDSEFFSILREEYILGLQV